MLNLNIFIFSFLTFASVFIVHILLWRILKPKNQITCLLLIFIVSPLMILLLLNYSVRPVLNIEEFMLSIILYYALAGVYIQTYPAIQANCPSLFISYLIGLNKSGASLNAIKQAVYVKSLTKVDARISDLAKDDFIVIDANSGNITLTSKGNILASLFIFYRSIFLGLKEGEG